MLRKASYWQQSSSAEGEEKSRHCELLSRDPTGPVRVTEQDRRYWLGSLASLVSLRPLPLAVSLNVNSRDILVSLAALRCRVELAHHILAQRVAGANAASCPLFLPSSMASTSILELGSGTGVLSCLLAAHFRRWTCSDIGSMLPLLRKNVKRNESSAPTAPTSLHRSGAVKQGDKKKDEEEGKTEIIELDWTWPSKHLKKILGASGREEEDQIPRYDVVLAVDCLFNESLVQPFVKVLNCVDAGIVVIVSELRSPEVLRYFLEHWLASAGEQGIDGQSGWEVWRACKSDAGDDATPEAGLSGPLPDRDGVARLSSQEQARADKPLLGRKYVVWVGWRKQRTVDIRCT